MAQTDYTGVASSAKLVGTLAAASGAGTVITVDNATGWPTGATGISFVGCFDRGSSTEEKILFSSRSGNNLTIAQRGYDDTTAITHLNGATVEHTVDATILRTSSAHIFDTTRDDHTQYLKSDGSRSVVNTATGTVAFKINAMAGTTADLLQVVNNGTLRFKVNAAGSAQMGDGSALATSAASGFLGLRFMPGTPTTAPDIAATSAAMVYDNAANKLWIYNAGWRSVTFA